MPLGRYCSICFCPVFSGLVWFVVVDTPTCFVQDYLIWCGTVSCGLRYFNLHHMHKTVCKSTTARYFIWASDHALLCGILALPLGQLSLLHMKHVRCKHLFHQPAYLPSDLSYSRHNHQESQKMYFKGAAASKGLFQRDLLTTYWSPLGHGRPSLSLLATAHLPLWCGYHVR